MSWKVPGVYNSALSLYNFETGNQSILSFIVELVNLTTDGGEILMQPVGSDVSIKTLKFSVLLRTEDNDHLELIIFSMENTNPGT